MERCIFPPKPHYWRAALFGSAAWLAASVCAIPASAQIYGPPIMGEQAVVRQLRQQGFRQLTAPTLNGVVYYLDGIDPRGQPVRIIARAADARILALHPQPGGRWTRVDPDEDAAWIDRRWRRYESRRWDGERFDDPARERHSRLPEGRRGDDWRDDGWREDDRREDDWSEPRATGRDDAWNTPRRTPLPEIDGGSTEKPPAPARRTPERVTVTPLPAPPAATRDPDMPAPTLKNPTVVKRSPTAIPRDPAEAKPPGANRHTEPKKKIGTEASRTAPGVGTRDNPRVIDMTPAGPKPPAAAKPAIAPATAPAAAPAPGAAATATPRPAEQRPAAAALPPPATLDAPAAAARAAPTVETPMVPPATLE